MAIPLPIMHARKTKAYASVSKALEKGIAGGVFPGAVVWVSDSGRPCFHKAFGDLSLKHESRRMVRDAVFDTASLTKPLATALTAARLVDDDKLAWDARVGDILPSTKNVSRGIAEIRVSHLLDHTSGFPAFRPYYMRVRGREGAACKREIRGLISCESLLSRPGQEARYSDLGYMMLEWILETVSGETMDTWLNTNVYQPLGLSSMGFNPRNRPDFVQSRYVQTAYCAYRKRMLQGETHDRNAFSVGGFSGHAGLFATAGDVGVLLSLLHQCYLGVRIEGLPSPSRVQEMFNRQSSAPGNSFCMGFDRPDLGRSSAGDFFSRRSVGHLGFTGTSFWMELDSGFTVVLFTNRLLSRPRSSRIRAFRPYFHDVAWKSFRGIQEKE